MNIAIIDDSKLLRDRLKTELVEISGIEIVGEAESLTQAKKLIEKMNLNIVFLDIRLNDGVSIDLIPQLKNLATKPTVIVLTNYPYPQYRTRCIEIGADYFLEKKKDFAEISKIIHELILKHENQYAAVKGIDSSEDT